MSKYQTYQPKRPERPRGQIHPIWRGIGCFIGVLIPILSYGLAITLIDYAIDQGWAGNYLPYWMFGTPKLPKFITNSNFLYPIFHPLVNIKHLYGIALFTMIIIVFFSGVLSLVYSILYRFIGPPRYSPIDAPPPRAKAKRYKR